MDQQGKHKSNQDPNDRTEQFVRRFTDTERRTLSAMSPGTKATTGKMLLEETTPLKNIYSPGGRRLPSIRKAIEHKILKDDEGNYYTIDPEYLRFTLITEDEAR
jgi:hypothetical protein